MLPGKLENHCSLEYDSPVHYSMLGLVNNRKQITYITPFLQKTGSDLKDSKPVLCVYKSANLIKRAAVLLTDYDK